MYGSGGHVYHNRDRDRDRDHDRDRDRDRDHDGPPKISGGNPPRGGNGGGNPPPKVIQGHPVSSSPPPTVFQGHLANSSVFTNQPVSTNPGPPPGTVTGPTNGSGSGRRPQ
jgi:hypothetical protein